MKVRGTHDAHHVGLALLEGADRRLRKGRWNGARTLDDFGRFTVQPTGQISSTLIADETSSILTAYDDVRDRIFDEMCDRLFTPRPSVVRKRQVRMVRNPANS